MTAAAAVEVSVTSSWTLSFTRQQGDGIRGERKGRLDRKGEREDGRWMEQVEKKGQSSRWEPRPSPATFFYLWREGEERRRRIIPSAESFLFHISFLSHHFICPPTPSSSVLALSCFRLYPFYLPIFTPLIRRSFLAFSSLLSWSISCLFMHPNVCNILLSIYRACGMKCVCLCVCVYMCVGWRFFGDMSNTV